MTIAFQFIDYHNLFNYLLCDSNVGLLQYFALTYNAGIEKLDCMSFDGGGFKICHFD